MVGCGSHFARRYYGNRFCFLFLWLLRARPHQGVPDQDRGCNQGIWRNGGRKGRFRPGTLVGVSEACQGDHLAGKRSQNRRHKGFRPVRGCTIRRGNGCGSVMVDRFCPRLLRRSRRGPCCRLRGARAPNASRRVCGEVER